MISRPLNNSEVGREVTEFPKRKLKEAAEDIETGRTYRESYRKNKIEAASSRGAEAELRHHKEKVTKETDKHNREKAFLMERAKTAGRLAAMQARQEAKQQYVVVGQSPRRRQWAGPVWQKSPYRTATADEIDPFHIYHFHPQQQTVPNSRVDLSHVHSLLGYNPNRNSQAQKQSQPKPNMSYMNSLLGFNPPSQKSQPKTESKAQSNKPKRRKFNIFTAQWEWI